MPSSQTVRQVERTLTLDDVVEILGKTPDYWARRARRREFPHLRVGAEIRFTQEQVAEIVRVLTVKTKHVNEPVESSSPSGQPVLAIVADPLASQTSRSRAAARRSRSAS